MKIALLDKSHDRSGFECEEISLVEYLQKQVNQDIKKNLATCFVALDAENNVIGYYTLSSESLGREIIPQKFQKKIPKNYNAPVILLGRLARHSSQKGTGLGEHLLLDALIRSYYLSQQSIGAMAVVVDPINKFAVNFYSKYGFIQLQDNSRMFIPMHVIGKIAELS